MKKFFSIVIIAAAMMVAMPADAQVKMGVKGGLNFTSISGDAKTWTDNKTGFFFGPTIKLSIPVIGLSFDGAFLYDERSAETADIYDDQHQALKKTLKQQTIQVPVNVRYGVGLGSLASFFAFTGPQFGFNVGDKDKEIFEGANWRLKSSNLSWNIGVGASLLKHLQATVNYNVALGKTGEFTVDNGIKNYDAKSNAWQIALAYYF